MKVFKHSLFSNLDPVVTQNADQEILTELVSEIVAENVNAAVHSNHRLLRNL